MFPFPLRDPSFTHALLTLEYLPRSESRIAVVIPKSLSPTFERDLSFGFDVLMKNEYTSGITRRTGNFPI